MAVIPASGHLLRTPSARTREGNTTINRAYVLTTSRGRSRALASRSGLLRSGLSDTLPGDVVNKLSRLHIEPSGNVQKRQHAGAALPMLDIDESAETQPATLRELFQTVSPAFSEASNLHTEGQESGIW